MTQNEFPFIIKNLSLSEYVINQVNGPNKQPQSKHLSELVKRFHRVQCVYNDNFTNSIRLFDRQMKST